MSSTDADVIVSAKLALMEGIKAAVKVKYGTPTLAAAALNVDPVVLLRVNCGTYWECSLTWLILMLERLGAKVNISVELAKPTPLKEALGTDKHIRRIVR